MIAYKQTDSKKKAHQSVAIPGRESEMAKNDAGGVTFVLDKWAMLDRFLILGAEGGTYYVTARENTARNCDNLLKCIKEDGPRVVAAILAVSAAGRAAKNEHAVFALARVFADGDVKSRDAAEPAFPQVVRIGTDLFHFCTYIQQFGTWNRRLRRTVANWYLQKEVGQLAYQLGKYQQRDGFSHLDALRLSHPADASAAHIELFKYVKGQEVNLEPFPILHGMQLVKEPGLSAKKAAALISEYRLTHEMIPTELKNSVEIWEALLPHMPLTAMIRNLGKMTEIGLLAPLSAAVGQVVAKFGDVEYVQKSRIHPLAALIALKVYASGRGIKGSLTWKAVPAVFDALNELFYSSFQHVEPTGKPILLALDVSGSMGISAIANCPLSAREVTACMAMVTARVEPNYHVLGFSGKIMDLPISPTQRLDDVLKVITDLPFDRTDCALPMLWATQRKAQVGGFVIYTDNETWYGNIHPSQALKQYRNQFGPAKLAVVATTASGGTIADPQDSGMLDVVGFDTATPAVIAEFLR